jgi:hypothetical protein
VNSAIAPRSLFSSEKTAFHPKPPCGEVKMFSPRGDRFQSYRDRV